MTLLSQQLSQHQSLCLTQEMQQALCVLEKPIENIDTKNHDDISDVIGQPLAKRALEIAASGNHNLLLLEPNRPVMINHLDEGGWRKEISLNSYPT